MARGLTIRTMLAREFVYNESMGEKERESAQAINILGATVCHGTPQSSPVTLYDLRISIVRAGTLSSPRCPLSKLYMELLYVQSAFCAGGGLKFSYSTFCSGTR